MRVGERLLQVAADTQRVEPAGLQRVDPTGLQVAGLGLSFAAWRLGVEQNGFASFCYNCPWLF